MNFAIIIRKTVDWENIVELPNPSSKPFFEKFLRQVDRWNDTFEINYFEYRALLKKISLLSLNKTNLPIFVDPSEFIKNNTNKDLVLIPIDDDDWLHPDIGQYLERHIGRAPIIQWQGWTYSTLQKKEQFNIWDRHYACSNDYCVNYKNVSKSEAEKFLKSHTSVPHNKYKVTNKPLSIWVRHLASLHSNTKGHVNFYPSSKLMSAKIPEEISWAAEYIEEFRQINRNFKIKWFT